MHRTKVKALVLRTSIGSALRHPLNYIIFKTYILKNLLILW